MEDDVTWVASNLSGSAGTLGAEAIELINWLLRFGCASEELRVVSASLSDWMANSSSTLRWALVKLVMRAVGVQANTAWGNLELCVVLEGGIEGVTHAMVKRRLESVKRIRR